MKLYLSDDGLRQREVGLIDEIMIILLQAYRWQKKKGVFSSKIE